MLCNAACGVALRVVSVPIKSVMPGPVMHVLMNLMNLMVAAQAS